MTLADARAVLGYYLDGCDDLTDVECAAVDVVFDALDELSELRSNQ